MDHFHLVNYSFNEHFNDYKFESNRLSQHHLHTESGYDSLLATSANSNSFFNPGITDSNDSSLFSLPSTPVKTPSKPKFMYNGNNCSTTPDFKQQYVADVNQYYFQSIRSSYDSSDNYVSSQSQSPKISYCASTDVYVSKRDTMTSKLLRSPAFKLEASPGHMSYQIERPNIKSFSSRFAAEIPKFERAVKTTPTEAEFMEKLIENHHLPGNPEFLIGRNVGVGNVNILGELNNKSMNNVMDKIFSYLTVDDVVRVGCVSKEWRNIIKSNVKLNKERIRFIKNKRFVYETTKENHGHFNSFQSQELDAKRRQFSQAEKRAMYKSSKTTNVGSNVFTSMDVNCLNNLQQPLAKKKMLERQFRDFSISEDTIFNMSPNKKRSPVKKSPIKRSPYKSPVKNATLICSKKSKKNLKRL